MHRSPQSAIRNILTIDPVVGVGTLKHGRLMPPWRDPEGHPQGTPPAATPPPAGTPPATPPPAGTPPAGTPPPEPKAGDPFVDVDGEKFAFPVQTPVKDMKPEEAVEYWRHKAKTHENAWKATPVGKEVTPEEFAAMQQRIKEFDESQLSASEKALKEAEDRGRSLATAEAVKNTFATLLDAHVAAAGLDKDKPEDNDVIETVQSLNPDSFITEGRIDGGRLSKVLNRLVPVGGTGAPPARWPDTGQGPRTTGTGSARDQGKAEAARRFGDPAKQQ